MNLGLWALFQYSGQLWPKQSLGAWTLRWRFFRAAVARRRVIDQQFKQERAQAFLAQAQNNPELRGFFLYPFLNSSWSVEQRFACQICHHDLIARKFPPLRLAYKAALNILDLGDRYPGLAFVLEDAPWFVREGCINFSMQCDGERLMTVSFTLTERDGTVFALVGSIQGSAREDVVETYKRLAAAMEDTRPRDLHFKVFRLFLRALGVSGLKCVADSHRAHNHPFFGVSKSEQVKLRYDELWQDQGGVLDDDGFYAMPVVMSDRPLSDVPTKKRGRYKRRLELLDQLFLRIQLSVAGLEHSGVRSGADRADGPAPRYAMAETPTAPMASS